MSVDRDPVRYRVAEEWHTLFFVVFFCFVFCFLALLQHAGS